MVPYRNRSDGSPSWQHKVIWNRPFYKGCVVASANRTGKSFLGAFETALMVTGEHPTYASPRNGIAWIVGLDAKQIAAIGQPMFERFIPKRYKDNGHWSGKLMRWILRSDGREWEVWFKSCDSGRQKFQGAKIDFAWIDEEPLDTSIFPEIELRLVDNQGIWLLTATPIEGTRWLKELMGRKDVFDITSGMRENPYIPLEEIEKVARSLTQDERDVRIEGKYIIFGGRPVFDRKALAEFEVKARPFVCGDIVNEPADMAA
jgi:phage terminase large subunit-like protein